MGRAVDDHHSAPPERIEKRPVILVEEHLDYFPAADPSVNIIYYLWLSLIVGVAIRSTIGDRTSAILTAMDHEFGRAG